jgi:hypothetical protein
MISIIYIATIVSLIIGISNAKQIAAPGVVQMNWKDSYTLPDDATKSSGAAKQLPIVVWHGLGDFCENPISMIPFVKFVANITNAEVHCLQIGDTWFVIFVLPKTLVFCCLPLFEFRSDDAENGWLMNINKQINIACNLLAKIPSLKGGFYGMGLSQGGTNCIEKDNINFNCNIILFYTKGLFIRGLKQRCAYAAPMKRLISIGGPQQGVVRYINHIASFNLIYCFLCVFRKEFLLVMAIRQFAKQFLKSWTTLASTPVLCRKILCRQSIGMIRWIARRI